MPERSRTGKAGSLRGPFRDDLLDFVPTVNAVATAICLAKLLSFICVSKDVYVAGGLASCLYITATGAAEMVWMIPNPAGICQGTKRPTNQRTSSYLPTLSMQNHKEKVLDRLVTSDSGQRLWCSEPCNRNKRERERESDRHFE